jgi:hypothetical protein
VRLLGLTAAGLVCGSLFVLAAAWTASGAGAAPESLTHTCSATDRDFIRTAGVNVAAVGNRGQEYLSGEVDGRVVVREAKEAAQRLGRTKPTDPALRRAQLVLGAMLFEYGKAIRAREAGRDAGPPMYRAYGLANFAADTLRRAQPELAEQGCDVADLL